MKKILCISLALLLSACVNPYAKFYRGNEDGRTIPGYLPATQPVQVYSSSDLNKDVPAMITRGYLVVGQSSFNGTSNAASDLNLKQQAEKIGAHIVLVNSRYTHTETGAVPLTIPQNSTTYSTAHATAIGPGGVVNAYGNGTSTTYSSQTVMVPFSVQRGDYAAVFMAKIKPRFGAQFGPLDEVARKRLETNQGVVVNVVMEGSPAYLSDILPGDILLKMGDDQIQSAEHMMRTLLQKYQGQTVSFTIDRNGKTVIKQVHLDTL